MARRFLVPASLVFFALPAASAATWTTIGPPGGIVTTIAFASSSPTIAYASLLGAGVFRSADGGSSWNATSVLPNRRTVALAVDPTDANVVYAGAYRGGEPEGGVFRTADGGATWTAASSGLSVEQILALRIDPAAPKTLYAGTVFGGIFRTADGGDSWHDVSSGSVAGATVVALAVDAASNVTASVIPNGNGVPAVVRSADGGAVWTGAGAGLPAGALVTAIAPQPGSASVLLAGTAADGIFVSTDGGASWAPSTSGFPPGRSVGSLAYDTVDPAIAYAGDDHRFVFRSVDGGATWTVGKPGSPPGVVATIAVQPGSHAALAGTTDAGILRSADGAHWFPSNFGVEAQEVEALAVDPAKPGTVYAGGAVGGLSVTRNGGATWARIDAGLPEVLSYDDAGWFSVGVAAIAIDPSNSSTLYAGLDLLGPGGPPQGGGLYKSADAGATWHPMTNGMTDGSSPLYVGHLAIDPSHPSTVYAAAGGRGLFRSTDAGGSWSAATGIPFSFANGVVVNPAAPATVLAVTSQGLYRSTDSGSHFGPSSTGFADSFAARAFAFDPAHPQRIFAGTFHGEIFTSEDGGATWTQTSADLSPHGVTGLAWVASSGTLFAATEDAGIFASADRGARWTASSDGLPTLRVRTMAGLGGSDVVYAGLYGGGVVVTGESAARGHRPILAVPPAEPATVGPPR